MSTPRITADRFSRLPQFGLLALLAFTTLLACGEDRITDTQLGPAVGLAIAPTVLSLIVGGEGRLTARFYDAKDRTINTSFQWSSAHPSIATVGRNDGNVIAISTGTTTVSATAGALSATVTVSVRAGDPVGLSISPPALSLIVGGEGRLTARAYDAKDRTINALIEWSSADPSIATVRSNGTVSAIAAGTTTVTATAGALKATASVSVRATDAVYIGLSALEMTLIAGEVEPLTAGALDASNRRTSASFEWSSADPAVATVGKTDGIVTAISLGATTVTVAAGALRATASVFVLPTAGSLSGTFAFTRGTAPSDASRTFDVLTFSSADRTPRSLPRPAQFASIAAPAWSTDGTLLAVEVIHAFFYDDYGHHYSSDLYVLGAGAPANAPWRALTADGLSRSPSWSPDGKRIAYVQQEALYSNHNHIHIIDAAGGEPVDLTRPEGQYGAPRWSPDGTRLAFSSAEGENSEIFIVNADGSGLTNVTRSSAFDYDPSWSPDGARLTFVSNRDGLPVSVFVVDADGSNVRRLTSLSGYCWGPACSPDGRQIIFSSGGALVVKNADGSSLARLIKTPQNSWDSAPVWRR